jgi:ABC-type transporter Mla subunit MlaD
MMKNGKLKKLAELLKKSHFRISLPGLGFEIPFAELTDTSTVDERVARLDQVKRDLEAAIKAVSSLQAEAADRKAEANQLQETVSRLHQDKNTAESLLSVPEESFVRLLGRASSKARFRGLLEGALIGFVTGVLSSLVVWYFTKGHR